MTSKKYGCGCLPILGLGIALTFAGLYFFNGKELTPLEGEDIKPWLGGAMFAMLPDQDKDDLLVIFGVKNKLKAYNFLQKLEKQEKQPIEKIDYQGITIFENTNLQKDFSYAALIDNKIILAREYPLVTS
jgi:hypothetical protein